VLVRKSNIKSAPAADDDDLNYKQQKVNKPIFVDKQQLNKTVRVNEPPVT